MFSGMVGTVGGTIAPAMWQSTQCEQDLPSASGLDESEAWHGRPATSESDADAANIDWSDVAVATAEMGMIDASAPATGSQTIIQTTISLIK